MDKQEALRLMQKGALLKASSAPPDKAGRERLALEFRRWIADADPSKNGNDEVRQFIPALLSLRDDLMARIEELSRPIPDPED